jgi:hypothetical protein
VRQRWLEQQLGLVTYWRLRLRQALAGALSRHPGLLRAISPVNRAVESDLLMRGRR